MPVWTTRAPLFIALALASTSALGCNTRSTSPELAGELGDPDLTPDQWDLAPVKMAVESTFRLEVTGSVLIRGVEAQDATVTATVSADGQSVSVVSSDPVTSELLLELERDGVTYEDIPVGLEVLEPDAIALEGEGTEHVFLGEAFSIGYTLEAEDALLVGHGFQPFDAPEGVTIAAVVRAESVGLINTVDRRQLSFEVAPEVDGFELTARRGGQDHTFTRANQDMDFSLTVKASEDDDTENVEVSEFFLVIEVSGQADGRPLYGGDAIIQSTDADCMGGAEPEDAVDGAFPSDPFALGSPMLLLANVAAGETLTCEYEVSLTAFPEARRTLVVEYAPREQQEGED